MAQWYCILDELLYNDNLPEVRSVAALCGRVRTWLSGIAYWMNCCTTTTCPRYVVLQHCVVGLGRGSVVLHTE